MHLLPSFAVAQPKPRTRLDSKPSLANALARVLVIAVTLCAILASLSPSIASAQDLEASLTALRASSLDPTAAIRVEKLTLRMGIASLEIEEGILVPARTADQLGAEFVFTGTARLSVDPPDEIEARQLELFASSSNLREPVGGAVLVIANDEQRQEIFARPSAELSPEEANEAAGLYDRWQASPERRLLGVENWLLRDQVGDQTAQSYVAARFESEDLGPLLYLMDPSSAEAVTLGRFVAVELEENERKKVRRSLRRAQRRGRLVGLDADELGTFDTWLSSPAPGIDPANWSPAFVPYSYQLNVDLDSRSLDFSSTAVIEMTAGPTPSRFLDLELFSDLTVKAVRGQDGSPLFFQRQGQDLLIALPYQPSSGEAVSFEVDYGGVLIERLRIKSSTLRETVFWYPQISELRPASFDVTYRWPKGFDLYSAGRKVDGGLKDGKNWERRVSDGPLYAFSFEAGRFKTLQAKGGIDDHVAITFAFDLASFPLLSDDKEELIAAVGDSLRLFEESFGRYPSDELTVVTANRLFSQSLRGFITLSSIQVADLGYFIDLVKFLTQNDPFLSI